MFWNGAATKRARDRARSALKFAILNNFERFTQFNGYKLPSANSRDRRCYSSCIWLTNRLPRTPPGTVTA